MSNWFKLYEGDADETRMRYAICKLAETWPVWTGLLMECCRSRSDTIRWGSNEQELFGFADRFKISIPKVNEAVNILCEIDYVERGENVLKVLKWSEKQDDYLTRKERGDYAKKKPSPILSDNHRVYPLEERRVEEIRGGEESPIISVADRIFKEGELKRALAELSKMGELSDYAKDSKPWKRRRELSGRIAVLRSKLQLVA